MRLLEKENESVLHVGGEEKKQKMETLVGTC